VVKGADSLIDIAETATASITIDSKHHKGKEISERDGEGRDVLVEEGIRTGALSTAWDSLGNYVNKLNPRIRHGGGQGFGPGP